MRIIDTILERLGLRKRRDPLADFEKNVLNRTDLVRDGVAFQFIEMQSGMFYVQAARRTKPYLQATFQVVNKADGEAWRDTGQVPSGEIQQHLSLFKLGVWPTKLPGSG